MALRASTPKQGDPRVEIDTRDVERALGRMEPVMREHLGWAIDITAKEIARLAGIGVPVRYGNLRSFIAARVNLRTLTARVGIAQGSVTIPADAPLGHAGRTVYPSFYGRLVHNGTARSRGTPFMITAAERERRPFAERYNAAARAATKQLHAEYRAAATRGGVGI
jgi:hypothetical protein